MSAIRFGAIAAGLLALGLAAVNAPPRAQAQDKDQAKEQAKERAGVQLRLSSRIAACSLPMIQAPCTWLRRLTCRKSRSLDRPVKPPPGHSARALM